jgi:glycosyltransferase involved in cell wall biosynthesis
MTEEDTRAIDPARVMFTYWGRRGALPQFTFEVACAAFAQPSIRPTISVSRSNENIAAFAGFGPSLFAVDTFQTNAGALLQAWRIPLLRQRLFERLRRDRIEAVIELMPHVWSPLVMSVVRAAGARYCTVIHDVDGHLGDRTTWVKSIIDRTLRNADLVLTLSSSVAGRLWAADMVPPDRVFTLFHPDLSYGARCERIPPTQGQPLRLLFLGRIMPYKGLPLFLGMVDLLRAEGIAVEVGVYGEGALGANAKRLEAIGAEVVNRWLSAAEIAAVLRRYHAVVLSHIEASQSGVAAAALGAGLPVIATPVGGLVQQVSDGKTGVLAARADASGLAEAAKRLLLDTHYYRSTCHNIVRLAGQRSMTRFVEDIVARALPGRIGD